MQASVQTPPLVSRIAYLGRLQSKVIVVGEEVARGRVGCSAGHDDPGDFNRGAWKCLRHTQEKNTGHGSSLSLSALVLTAVHLTALHRP